nr:hypothetical protein GCM10020092_035440 [Actinoplanes digitatis]
MRLHVLFLGVRLLEGQHGLGLLGGVSSGVFSTISLMARLLSLGWWSTCGPSMSRTLGAGIPETVHVRFSIGIRAGKQALLYPSCTAGHPGSYRAARDWRPWNSPSWSDCVRYPGRGC